MKSLQSRIQTAVVSVTLIVVVTIVILVKGTVERMVVKKENAHAQEALDLALMTIRGEDLNYSFHRQALLDERRQSLKSVVENGLATIAHAHSLFLSGELSEEKARRLAQETVRQMRYAGGSGYIWIQDCMLPIPNMLMHPAIPEIEGGPGIDRRYYEALDGETNLLTVFVNRTEEGPAYVQYKWPKPTPEGLTSQQPKLSYVSRFKPWGWLVGTGLYIDDIEKTCSKHRQDMIANTMRLLKEVRLMESGYLYIFDSDGIMLLHPRLPIGESGMQILDPETGLPIFQEIMDAAHTPEGRLEYLWNKPGMPEDKSFRKIAYVRYFEPLDWYVAASIYEDELHAPARMLSGRILWVSTGLLLFAIILCWWLVRSITQPLTRLADLAHRIQAEGVENVDSRELQVHGPYEVETLGLRLHQLVNSLHEEKEQLRATLDSIGDAVIATDAEGDITRMNPVAEALTAWTLGEAIGRPLPEVLNIIHGATRKSLENPVYKVMNSGEAVELGDPVVLIARDGSEFRITDSGAPIRNDQGEIIGVVLVFHDVTEKYAVQEQLQQSQKMEAIGELAGGVAHDFNNMLGGIMGAAELLDSSLKDQNPDTKQYLSLIMESTQHAADLATQLLAFGRKQSVVAKPVSMHQIVYDTIDILKKTIDKRIAVETDLAAEAYTVMGDASRLQNALLNLGINAAHAMPEGGRLSFESKVIEIDSGLCDASPFDLSPGPHIDITVCDTGLGIRPEHLKKIFEPFFTTKPQGKGTGLGLAACYGTIQQHKGAISVNSHIGHGTTFNIVLPLTEAKPDQLVPDAQMHQGGGTILLVDDENVIRVTGEAILKRYGYRVLVAKDGEEAVEQYRAEHDKIDLVVCDMVMPRMNGRDCFFAIKKINPQVRFILASGFIRGQDTLEMEKQGLAWHIKKPFHTADFIQMVQHVLAS